MSQYHTSRPSQQPKGRKVWYFFDKKSIRINKKQNAVLRQNPESIGVLKKNIQEKMRE